MAALQVQNLSSLESDLVTNNLNFLEQLVQAAFPMVDVKRGPVHDLVLYLGAVLATANQTNIDLARKSSSLLEIAANPVLGDTKTVDNLLSNYQVTRAEGAIAIGTVTIVINSLIPVTIAKGSEFTANGLTYFSDNVYNGRVSPETVIASNDKLMTPVSGGFYIFPIGVKAADIGGNYNISSGTQLLLTSPPTSYVSSYVETDIAGGMDPDTNETLLTKLETGMAIKAWSNRVTNEALILEQPGFENVLAMSEVGYGDAEQIRYHSIFPVAFGGRTDLYVRSQALPNLVVLNKAATLVSKVGSIGTWQFSISSEDAPGYYEVTKVIRSSDLGTVAGYVPTSDTRGFNLAATTYVPDITATLEAIYSRYQTAAIQFADIDTDATGLSLGTTANYKAYVKTMPLIKEIQDFSNGRDVRNPCGDTLIKAAVPCYVTISFILTKTASDTSPDMTNLKSIVADTVNNLGFPGSLTAAAISKAVLGELTGTNITVSNINMTGRVRKPNGTNTYLNSASVLTIPSDTANLVSNLTTVFILDPADVTIVVV